MSAPSGLLSARLLLAPMAGAADAAVRVLMRELGADAVVSELLSSEGLCHGSKRTRQLMRTREEERPAGIQIFGSRPEAMAEAARACEEGGADFVDINMGCPVPKVIRTGGGAALMREPERARAVVRAVRQAVSIPVTVKMRLGWDAAHRNAPELARMAADEGALWVVLHGRTADQGYSGLADWDAIRRLAADLPIPLVGNGDVDCPARAAALVQEGAVHAVMIGRGALADPYIFLDAKALLSGAVPVRPPPEGVLRRLAGLMARHGHPRTTPDLLRKAFVSFSTGMSGKSAFRERLFTLGGDPEAILAAGLEFLTAERFRLRNVHRTFRNLPAVPPQGFAVPEIQ